ncbi:type III secretion system outer membrane ring subunit SctC [Xylophilus ampelinus]|uniref:Type III secretion protein C n=1 Tax=Xylophilus ampelinus TaxID=54067 RepID=A0A318SHL5_9BURK|nr:type III secretion system outer membrane ring subunit SctC [Xylophilus ampelinus]MCS4510423.1 type III secretion system outer membrane ring subunit SctC [Xylophilus ampelinus]PYE77877.1 type III secretion protein C [Xylophilus ampelinus]
MKFIPRPPQLPGLRCIVCLTTLATVLAAIPPAWSQPGGGSTAGGGVPISTAAGRDGPGNQRFVYRADSKRLADVLNDFASSQGFPAVVDQRVEGVVSGNFDTGARQFLDGLCKAYALIWYFDGTAYYFYPANAIQSRIFRLKGYQRRQVVQLLDSLRLASDRFPIRWDSTNSTLLVYGPPRHVELVGLAVESLDVGAIEQNRRVIRVFPLSHVSAADRSMGSVQVHGIVSTLRSVFGSGAARQDPASALANAQKNAARSVAPTTRSMQQMYGAMQRQGGFLSSLQGNSGDQPPSDGSGATPAPRAVRSPLDGDTDDEAPVFEADENSNSVIVYAKAQRMEEIGTLIRTLDVLSMQVELEATVIDVSTDNLSALGVDWSVQGTRGQFSVSGPSGGDSVTGSGTSTQPFTVATVLTDAGRSLMARVQALAGEGRARVISKPRVLGEANRPAVMADKRIASVRVAGNLDVKLFQVEAGTTMQVTPQVTPGANGQPASIKLSILIEDGSFQSTSVDQVPVVKRTEIRTEARVLEGQSLLIGGITVDSEITGETGVPLLKDIPLLGAVFRQRQKHLARSERMFLLTPLVMMPVAPTVAAVAPSTPGVVPAPSMTAPDAAALPGLQVTPSGGRDEPVPLVPRDPVRPLVDRLADPASYGLREGGSGGSKSGAGVRKS